MRDLFDKEFQKEMDDFFDYIDYEVLGREKPEDDKMTDEEAEYWEMKAEIHNEVQVKRFYLSIVLYSKGTWKWWVLIKYSFPTTSTIILK